VVLTGRSEPSRSVMQWGSAMLATLTSATMLGVDGHPVAVEVHVANGLPAFAIVGLADLACREARDRVRAAIVSSGLTWPLKRITVNLAPADLRKIGSGLDLAIAVGVLIASEVLSADAFDSVSLVGELGLDGTVRSVPGLVSLVDGAPNRVVIVPAAGAHEAACVPARRVLPIRTLRELADMALGNEPWPDPVLSPPGSHRHPVPDLADVRGQAFARRAIETAAAGGHHVLLCGSPGAGKTMLAKRMVGLLPSLSAGEALDVLRIRSAAGLADRVSPESGLDCSPPFRAPHHCSSMVSLLGGGTVAMRPGELSLAHRGVLFLDELSEFGPSVLDSLRQPLEEGVVRISRARGAVVFPAKFQLVAATNPCPCGWRTGQLLLPNDATPRCGCAPHQLERMRRRLSGPLLDRIDVRVDVVRPAVADLLGEAGEPTAAVAERVAQARSAALHRGFRCNAEVPAAALRTLAPFAEPAERVVESLLSRGVLTARGMDRVRRVALTIQDLEGRAPDTPIGLDAVMQAVELRRGAAAPLEAA
jgi:magnesium chelatase family protein